MTKLLLALVLAASAIPASATVYDFAYSSDAQDDAVFGSHVAVSGQFTTEDAPEFAGSTIYALTAISGTRNGVSIDGIDLASNYSFNEFDPVLHTVDFAFLVGGVSYNLYGTGPFWSEFDGNLARTTTNLVITPASAEVPEPAMLGLFGLGAIGLGLGRRRKV